MRRNMALIVSGVITTFALVLTLGLLIASGQLGQVAQAAPATRNEQAAVSANDGLSTDVRTLQAEVIADREQLQQAYAALQQAYDQIQVLSAGNGLRSRSRGLGLNLVPVPIEPSD